MRARAHIVHLRCGSGTAQCALLHETVDLVGAADGPLAQALNEDSLFLILTDLQRGAVDFKQIGYHLVVNLQVTGTDHECCVL